MEQIKRKRGRPRKIDTLLKEEKPKINPDVSKAHFNLIEIIVNRNEIYLKTQKIREKDYIFFVSCFNALSGLADYYSFVKFPEMGKIQFVFSKNIPVKLYGFIFPFGYHEKYPAILTSFIEDLKIFITRFLKYYNIPVTIREEWEVIEYLKPIFEGRLETLLEKENIRFESTLEALLKDKTIPEEEKIDLVISELDKRIPDNERCGCVLEIKVGLGGLESYYFNHTLMTEYLKIFKMLNIKHEIFDLLYPEENYNEYKGIRFVRINIESPVYFLLKFEHGKHRLIEISPFTKKRQTTISFIEVFPIYEGSEIKLNENDLKIESMKATGKGGQYVNKTESAVRVTHIPTGITITCQSERSQYQNKKLALNLLKSKLMELNKEKERNEIKELRKNIIYNKFSNYIRTYYYDEDKVVDIQLDKFVTPLKNALLNIFGYKLLKVYLEEQAEEVKK